MLLEARVNESAGQYATLGAMYQELTKNRSDWLLSEVEHTLGIASQQLQLAGNVSGAITALEMVDNRLARFDNPALIPVKKAVSKDLETLKALPYLDSVGLTVKLGYPDAGRGNPAAGDRPPPPGHDDGPPGTAA